MIFGVLILNYMYHQVPLSIIQESFHFWPGMGGGENFLITLYISYLHARKILVRYMKFWQKCNVLTSWYHHVILAVCRQNDLDAKGDAEWPRQQIFGLGPWLFKSILKSFHFRGQQPSFSDNKSICNCTFCLGHNYLQMGTNLSFWWERCRITLGPIRKQIHHVLL